MSIVCATEVLGWSATRTLEAISRWVISCPRCVPSRKDRHQFGESSKKTPTASDSICGSEARLAEEPLIKAGGEAAHVQTKITAGHQFYLPDRHAGKFYGTLLTSLLSLHSQLIDSASLTQSGSCMRGRKFICFHNYCTPAPVWWALNTYLLNKEIGETGILLHCNYK